MSIQTHTFTKIQCWPWFFVQLYVSYRHGIRPVYPPHVSCGLNRSRDIPAAAGEGLYASPRVLHNRFAMGRRGGRLGGR